MLDFQVQHTNHLLELGKEGIKMNDMDFKEDLQIITTKIAPHSNLSPSVYSTIAD